MSVCVYAGATSILMQRMANRGTQTVCCCPLQHMQHLAYLHLEPNDSSHVTWLSVCVYAAATSTQTRPTANRGIQAVCRCPTFSTCNK
jgi:hypothetical protein